MLERLMPREDVIPAELFASKMAEDNELQELVKNLREQMHWIADGEGEDEYISHLEKAEGYDQALKSVQGHLDKARMRYSELAIAAVVADIMDVKGKGYSSLVY